jgi:hypothetical protein
VAESLFPREYPLARVWQLLSRRSWLLLSRRLHYVLTAAFLGAALVFAALSILLPFAVRGGSHLSDIALLLLVAGLPCLLVAFGLFIRRSLPLVWSEVWRESRPSWSLLVTLVCGVAINALTVWAAVADLAAPPSVYGRAVELPDSAQLAFTVAFIGMLLSSMLMFPETTWRSWRARRLDATETLRR